MGRGHPCSMMQNVLRPRAVLARSEGNYGALAFVIDGGGVGGGGFVDVVART